MTTSPIVATKLFVPTLRQGIIERGRLDERLARGAESKLTLISAPAGFGKTTMVANWLANRSPKKRTVAWLSIDQTDNEPTLFWSHLIAAVEKAAGAVGAPLGTIQQPGQQPIELVYASFVNELSAFSVTVDLVLDDYHIIEQADVHRGVQFLLEHMPSHVHMVISTRSDPPLPIARLRARGELVELRSADLRFTTEEAATYLNDAMGLSLTEANISALEQRTEGWAAALQLAALSIQGRADVNAFITGFTGQDRYVFDYLVEEVLDRQSVGVRTFLLQTCFLERLSGPLCDAVTGVGGGREMLDALYRANLFLIPLDNRREWFRYHHLFADVLATQLDETARRQLPSLHQRASDWYEEHGERSEAIKHAFAGGALERAAALIELAIPQMRRDRGQGVMRAWIERLPDVVVRSRPVICVAFAGILLSNGELAGVQDLLRDAEQGLALLGKPSSGFVAVGADQLRGLPAQIELYRTALAQVRGDVADTIVHAQRAFDLAPPDDHLGRAGAAGFLGIAHWTVGALEPALRSWAECVGGLQRAGHLADALGSTRAIADILAVQGRLREAVLTCENALQLPTNGSPLLGTADLHARLIDLYRERNELAVAHEHLAKCKQLGEPLGLSQYPCRLRVAAARLLQAEGDFAGAADLLDEAERLYASDFFPDVQPVAAIRARAWIAWGRLDDARRWANDVGVTSTDELSYMREFEHITLARLLLAQQAAGVPGAGAEVGAFLARLLAAADGGGRTRSVIEIAILCALAHQHNDSSKLFASLERALALAEPEDFARLFLDEGQAMYGLLKSALKHRIAPAYVRRLLAASGQSVQEAQAHSDLIEPLSDRELDVLKLLRTDLGGPEIARELAVSLNTVRTHTKAIYEKLGVNNRRAAVRRAAELDLRRSDRR